jgi:ADP-ribosyl-[dinitrogen reductase] hydrolase
VPLRNNEFLDGTPTASPPSSSLNIDDVADPHRPAGNGLLGAGIPIVEHLTALEELIAPEALRVPAAYHSTVPHDDFAGRVDPTHHRGGLDPAERIAAAMLAFAAGDALGVPWEGSAPEAIDPAAIPSLPARRWGWPRGATSDDTAQVLLVAELLADTGGHPTSEQFMVRLADAAEEIRGIGPTTGRALKHFRETGRLPEPDPAQRPTNGAAMRMLPVGWTTPATDPELRRELTRTLAVGTHQAPQAIGAACVVTAMGSWAIDGVSIEAVLTAAASEVEWVARHHADLPAVRAALAGEWRPPTAGVDLDAAQTVAAIVHVLRSAPDLATALPLAVSLGGDTDTVAAMVGGILGARTPGRVRELEWLTLVDFEERPHLAARLHELRRSRYVR